MNREIKFRAWDNKNKRYVNIVRLILDQFGALDYADVVYKGKIYKLYKSEIILEQDTGVKDKNGGEIYDGDIVSLEYYEKPFGKKKWVKIYPNKDGEDINRVEFEEGYFKFSNVGKDGYGSELFFSDYGEWIAKERACKYVAEVIGNINENKELLK